MGVNYMGLPEIDGGGEEKWGREYETCSKGCHTCCCPSHSRVNWTKNDVSLYMFAAPEEADEEDTT